MKFDQLDGGEDCEYNGVGSVGILDIFATQGIFFYEAAPFGRVHHGPLSTTMGQYWNCGQL